MNNWYLWFTLGMLVVSFLGIVPMIIYDIYLINKKVNSWLKLKISEADRQDLIALAKGLERFPSDPEEVEAIRKAILEIVEAKPVTARKLEDTL